jgi:tetratricopeptide (TPR) repeat protein
MPAELEFVQCNQCGATFEDAPGVAVEARAPCPVCGSKGRKFGVDILTGHYNLGLMLELLGSFRESLSAFERALPLAEDVRSRQTTVWHIGVGHYNLGSFKHALRAFKAAAELDTTDVTALGFAAVSAVRLQEDSEALALWGRALAVDPEYFSKAQPGERVLYNRSKESLAKRRAGGDNSR